MWAKIVAYIQSKKISAHTLVGAVVATATLYATVPQVTQFVNQIAAHSPKLVISGVSALVAVCVYWNTTYPQKAGG